MEMEIPVEQQTTAMMPRACPNCRIRKVRCNKVHPCSNCVTSGLACRSSTKATSLLTQRKAIELPPPSSSDDVKALSTRLSALEESVGELRKQLSTRDKPQSSRHYISEETTARQTSDRIPSSFPEGHASLVRQILLASRVTELTDKVSGYCSPAVLDEVTNLRNMAEDRVMMEEEMPGSTSDSGPRPGPRLSTQTCPMALPPADVVLKLLRSINGTQSILFLLFGINDKAQVEHLCTRVYFPIEPPSAAEMTLFNGMIAILLEEQDMMRHRNSQEHVQNNSFRAACETNFQAGVEKYEVLAIPTYEHALILSLAMLHAQKEAKIRLQWSLTSAAARHCLALGYHREEHVSQIPHLEAERVRKLFWQVYTSDKHLSSRLGRTAIIQDHDMDVKECEISADAGRAPWDMASRAFVELSRIQALIYDSLYSVSAKKTERPEREARVSRLAARLHGWHDGWIGIDATRAYHKDIFECTFRPVEMVYYSILTLVHRGSTMSNSINNIPQACFEAAHHGLQAHLALYSHPESSDPLAFSYYAVWLFYYTAFTPFVVTFLHCIFHSDVADLKQLGHVLDTLDQIGTSFEYAKRQYDLCKALHRTATAYLDSQNSLWSDRPINDNVSLPLQSLFDHEWLELQQYSQAVPFPEPGDWETNLMN